MAAVVSALLINIHSFVALGFFAAAESGKCSIPGLITKQTSRSDKGTESTGTPTETLRDFYLVENPYYPKCIFYIVITIIKFKENSRQNCVL